MKKAYFPLFVDISKKRILIIGGGKIASRRAETLLAFAEDIWVVSPALTKDLQMLVKQRRIHWIGETYRADLLKGADMVLAAASDSACNEQVANDCRCRGIPVNTAHKKELCDFYFPGIVKKDHMVIGVTASGTDHRRAKMLRMRLAQAMERIDREDTDE